MNSLFTNLLQQMNDTPKNIFLDVIHDDKYIYIYADLPGVKKEDLSVNVRHNKLSINCKRENNYASTQLMEKSELIYGEFTRTIQLPVWVTKKEAVSSSYENGVLCVKIDKTADDDIEGFSIEF